MSANTKIVVLRRKELLYTGIFAALGVLFIILLLMLLLPGKDTDASYGTPDSPDDTAATEMPDNVADVSTGAVADTGNTYIPGIYTTELILGSETVNVEVIVSDHAITSVSLADPSETLTTMYPLLESTMESLNDQLCEMQDPEQVNQTGLRDSGCAGIFFPSKNHIHVVFGPHVEFVRNAVDKLLKG